MTAENIDARLDVWRSRDGVHWAPVGPDGFGDPNNRSLECSGATTVFADKLYMRTVNFANGGEIWVNEYAAYLPVAIR